MFKRPHHQAVAKILRQVDTSLFLEAKCYFGGGTAIALMLDEYRKSVDIDFLCSDRQGYRLLREAVFDHGASGLFAVKPDLRREARSDMYGIRFALEAEGHDAPIRFEIVFESRIDLSGDMDGRLGVPVLSMIDRYATKLLANADRYCDPETFNRDAIDLAMMASQWGPIPDAAFLKARQAYGPCVDTALKKATARLSDPAHMAKCLERLDMDLAQEDAVRKGLGIEATMFDDDWDENRQRW